MLRPRRIYNYLECKQFFIAMAEFCGFSHVNMI